MSAAQHSALVENINLAMALGATVVYRESENVAGAILEFVRSEKVRTLVLGRPGRTGLRGRVSPGIVHRVLEGAEGLDVVVADLNPEGPG
jgi:K+-sensing histidine kinase KdpD